MAEVKAKLEVTLEVPAVPSALQVLDSRALDPHSIDLRELDDATLKAVGAAWTEKLLAEAHRQQSRARQSEAPKEKTK